MQTLNGHDAHISRVLISFIGTVIVAQASAIAAPTHSTGATQPAIAQAPSWPVLDPRIEHAWKEFEQINGDTWKVRWNERTGLPCMIYGAKSAPLAGDAAQVARAFLAAHPVLFGLDDPAMSLAFQSSRPLKSYQRVQFGLRYRELDVMETRFVLLVDRFGSVVHVTNDPKPVQLGSVIPDIDANSAKVSALKAVEGKTLTLDEPPQLVILPDGQGHLVYRALPRLENENLHYEVIVDANSGEVLRARRLTKDYRAQPASPTHFVQSQRVAMQSKHDSSSGRLGPASSPAVFGPGVDPCDGEWQYSGPPGETTVTPTTTPLGTPSVRVTLGAGNLNDSVVGVQTPAFYGAGLKLLPCKQYTVRFTANVSTWDTYNDQAGDPCIADFRDVFLVNVNSEEFLWNVLTREQTGNLSCEDVYSESSEYPPGKTWQFGGAVAGHLCNLTKTLDVLYSEADETSHPYLTFGLDTAFTASSPDDAAPSWGTFDVEILGATQVFDPNPYGDGYFPFRAGQDDNGDDLVPCANYRTVTLSDFHMQPESDGLWHLNGNYVEIREDLEAPEEERPQCRDSSFPYTRSCKGFEAVMCYYHLTRTMKYVESLSYTLHNKPIRVDPHGLDGQHNAHYVSPPLCGLSSCNGYLAFGDGGVDAAEDADVILHEYGHALQDEQSSGAYNGSANPTGDGDETAAMGEGFADYWAFSNTADRVTDAALLNEWFSVSPRRIDTVLVYPDDLEVGGGEREDEHHDGVMWGGTLWDLYNSVGKSVADDVILMSHSLITSDPTFVDGIRALIAADELLYDGVHRLSILQAGASRGIIRGVSVEARVSGVPAPGVPIAFTITDENGTAAGVTPFLCYFGYGALAGFTAPPTANAGSTFHGWSDNFQPPTSAAQNQDIIVDGTHILEARYAVQRNPPPPPAHHP